VAHVLAPVPVPIGLGPRYQPPPALHGPCHVAPLRTGRRVHIELFGNRRVVIAPARLGVRGRCRAHAWTTDPTGVVRFDAPETVAGLFAVWGRPFGPRRLLSFRGPVRAYRNGVRVRGDPRRLHFRDHDELVFEIGGYVPPHRSYLFPPH
jgi:hypothetical protein